MSDIRLSTKFGNVRVHVNNARSIYVGVGDFRDEHGKREEFTVRGVSIRGSMYFSRMGGASFTPFVLEKPYQSGSVFLDRRDSYTVRCSDSALKAIMPEVTERLNEWALTEEGRKVIAEADYRDATYNLKRLNDKIEKLSEETAQLQREYNEKFYAMPAASRYRFNVETDFGRDMSGLKPS